MEGQRGLPGRERFVWGLKIHRRIKRCWESVPNRDHSMDIGWDGEMFGKHLSIDSLTRPVEGTHICRPPALPGVIDSLLAGQYLTVIVV